MINKSPKIKLFTLLLITLITLICIIGSSLNVNQGKKTNPIAVNGVIDLRNWDFNKDGIIKLDGQWEFYHNQLLTPEDFYNQNLKKSFKDIPGTIGEQSYGTYRLKILVNRDDYLYSVKINYLQNAFKLWANDKYVVSVGKVGRDKKEMQPQILPKVGSFYAKDGEVDLILEVSNFYSKYGFIDTLLIGEASKIDSYREKKQAFDLFLFGSCIIAALYNLAVFSKRKKDKASLYFAIVCLIVALRTIFTGERFFISLFPNFDYIFSVKIMVWTFYLYIPFIVLFVNKNYGEILSRKAVKLSNFLAVIYGILVLVSPTQYYIQFIVLFEIHALLMMLYMMWKISKVYIEQKTSDYIAVVGLFALFITRINDILYEYSIIMTNSLAPLGVFIFIVANYYVLAERQAKALSNSEEVSERLKSLNNLKDDFLAITSHELKTPLNGIIGLTENLSNKGSNSMSDDDRYNLFLINASARRLSNLVDDVIMFSKLKNNEIKLIRKPVKIDKILEMVIKFCEPTISNKAIELVNLVDEEVPCVKGDENRIQQIFYNLLGNAIKFTQEGKILISYLVKENFVEISIKDTGIGISDEKINTIFNIYEQGEDISEKYGGTGLGLYITKNLIGLHGGEISVSSVVGKGSKFTFTLPLCSERELLTDKSINCIEKSTVDDLNVCINKIDEKNEDDLSVKNNKNYKILIVDDEYVNLKVLEEYLSGVSQHILRASTGKQAIEIIDQNKDLDLVILDMMIPDLLGYDICSIIREKYSLFELPVLMMTVDNRTENLVLSLKCGANDYLTKPFSKQELLARVNTLLTLKYSVKEALTLVQQVEVANEKIDTLNLRNSENTKRVEELMEYNKLKTEFFTNISHELKTPLNVISTTVQLLRSLDGSKQLGDERIKYYFNIINQNSLRLLRLINNLIDTTKIDGNYLSLHLTKGDIIYVIEELVQSVADFVNSQGISIVFDTEVEEKFILFDEEKIERIILNLLSNAVKFTDINGSIFINIYDKGEFVEISIRDTGIGIPENKLEFIFERFAQVDRSTTRKKEGSGIGLALVKSLVEMHEGTICAKSELGKGSEFIITLPVKSSNEEEVEGSALSKEFAKSKYEEKMQIEFSDIYFDK
ncbi:ATP-binding protein [Clostridium sp. CX1]|uniref:ATP-binding protein n=1 Tax=Clostridium sp. CX1 TaxID=2978346 RepID=UPI0021C0AD93|nr:ATP-binding protein [Clostridium sp. CX1]MCT8977148.1 ATP-binding protein [Clostridium sp. CX1]